MILHHILWVLLCVFFNCPKIGPHLKCADFRQPPGAVPGGMERRSEGATRSKLLGQHWLCPDAEWA